MQSRTRSHTAAASAAAASADAAARADALRYNFLSCLFLTAQNGFGQDVEPFLALSRETWGEEQLWAAVKDLPHGRARQEGPAPRHAAEPFGFERGPFSAGRTHVMYAAQAGLTARLVWLIARGARLELKDWKGRTALFWASQKGRVEAVRELLARGAVVGTADNDGFTPLHIAIQRGHLGACRAASPPAAVSRRCDGGLNRPPRGVRQPGCTPSSSSTPATAALLCYMRRLPSPAASLSTISPTCASSMMKGGASRMWSPFMPPPEKLWPAPALVKDRL
jgi:hypothetical protein